MRVLGDDFPALHPGRGGGNGQTHNRAVWGCFGAVFTSRRPLSCLGAEVLARGRSEGGLAGRNKAWLDSAHSRELQYSERVAKSRRYEPLVAAYGCSSPPESLGVLYSGWGLSSRPQRCFVTLQRLPGWPCPQRMLSTRSCCSHPSFRWPQSRILLPVRLQSWICLLPALPHSRIFLPAP